MADTSNDFYCAVELDAFCFLLFLSFTLKIHLLKGTDSTSKYIGQVNIYMFLKISGNVCILEMYVDTGVNQTCFNV